jgi:hypothetical protein
MLLHFDCNWECHMTRNNDTESIDRAIKHRTRRNITDGERASTYLRH